MKKLDYVGGGYFRERGVKKGDKAEIFHAPELVASLNARIAELELENAKLILQLQQVEADKREANRDCRDAVREARELRLKALGFKDVPDKSKDPFVRPTTPRETPEDFGDCASCGKPQRDDLGCRDCKGAGGTP